MLNSGTHKVTSKATHTPIEPETTTTTTNRRLKAAAATSSDCLLSLMTGSKGSSSTSSSSSSSSLSQAICNNTAGAINLSNASRRSDQHLHLVQSHQLKKIRNNTRQQQQHITRPLSNAAAAAATANNTHNPTQDYSTIADNLIAARPSSIESRHREEFPLHLITTNTHKMNNNITTTTTTKNNRKPSLIMFHQQHNHQRQLATLVAAALVLLVALAASGTTPVLGLADSSLYAQMQKMKISPDIIDASDANLIQVSLNGKQVKPGDPIPARNFKDIDILRTEWPSGSMDAQHTLILLDLDRKPRINSTTMMYNQFTSINIPGHTVMAGQTIVSLEPPTVPCQPSIKHRILMLAFHQSQTIDIKDILEISASTGQSSKRENFKLNEFISRHRLHLVGANVFLALGESNGICSGSSTLNSFQSLSSILIAMVIVKTALSFTTATTTTTTTGRRLL